MNYIEYEDRKRKAYNQYQQDLSEANRMLRYAQNQYDLELDEIEKEYGNSFKYDDRN